VRNSSLSVTVVTLTEEPLLAAEAVEDALFSDDLLMEELE